ncbi:MAG: hypothetical protein ACO3ND_06175 [Opitutales bacterium]
MSQVRALWAVGTVLLAAAGASTDRSWAAVRPCIPELGPRQLELGAGQGVMLGVLGGLRTVMADVSWLRSYVLWERKDQAGSEALMRLACTLDPHARYFWEQTGFAVGLDMANWEIRRRGGYAKLPKEIQDHLFTTYARKAIAILDEGARVSRSRAPLLIVAGQLAEMKLKDLRLAAAYYRTAAECDDAPWYAARFSARTLWGAGDRREAYDWFKAHWLSTLRIRYQDKAPDDLAEIRMMEDALLLPLAVRVPRQPWER